MLNRSFYLYKLKYPREYNLPDLSLKFSESNIKNNILEISISEEEKRKYLFVITSKEGDYLYGIFYKLKQEKAMSVVDEENGEVSLRTLEDTKAWAEKSRFIIDLKYNLILGEYNYSGIRFFQQPLGEYLRKSLNKNDLDIEVVYNKESYENIGDRDIKYFKIKVTKPKLSIMEDIFGLTGLEVLKEADESQSLFIELKINAGRRKNFNKDFVKRILGKFDGVIDKEGIKKFEVGQCDFDTPLELVKDKILKREVNIEGMSDDDIFSQILETYQDLNLNELLDIEENGEE